MKLLSSVILAVFAFSAIASAQEKNVQKKIEVAAVYYPHWHTYPDGEEWLGKDWTEWEFVKTTIPRFKGHKFLTEPLLGYIDGENPRDVEKEIALASNCGIDVFLYDWYWYDGQMTMQESIEQAFLKACNKEKMKFAIMWAYHDRFNRFRAPDNKNPIPLMLLARTPEEFIEALEYCADNYFKNDTYWRVKGKPFFSMYDVEAFIKSMGGAENTKKTLDEVDARMKARGLPPVHWNAMTSKKSSIESVKKAGFESVTTYVVTPWLIPNHVEKFRNRDFIFDYADLMAAHKRVWNEVSEGGLPYMPVVSRGWDSTARCRNSEPFPWKELDYPYCGTVINNTADRFESLLKDAKEFSEKSPDEHFAILINAWNEYTEGSYLLPDVRDGDASLRAIASVFGRNPSNEYVFSDMTTKKMLTLPKADFENLSYGGHYKQKLDVWLAKNDKSKKTPAIVYIHGGGWTSGGMEDRIIAGSLEKLLQKGISVICINYRFLQDAQDDDIAIPVSYPMADCAAAVKFVKGKAAEWNIDADNIAVMGSSAGGCSALWVGLSDEGEKVKAIGGFIAQTSLDPKQMRSWIRNINYGYKAFGFKSFQEYFMQADKLSAEIKKYSPYALLKKGAPQIVLQYSNEEALGARSKDATHSSVFGSQFKNKCDELGVDCSIIYDKESAKIFDAIAKILKESSVK